MIRHVTRWILAALAAGLLPVPAVGQTPSAFPVDVRASLGPQPVMVDRAEQPYRDPGQRGRQLSHPRPRSRTVAVYAHLQPGSLRLKVGDRVRAGDVLGLLGNSGNSDAPHLHFHMVDANSVMGAEGTPYEFETFDQLGLAEGPESLDTGQAWKPKSGEAPVAHRRELPNDNAVVAFPSTSGR